MSKYQFNSNMREISGFGGGYEDGCRKMVVAGMEWFDENPNANVAFAQYENITGITTDETPDCKKLQNHMNKAIDDEASGAMMQACLIHVMYAHKKGWDKYISEMEELGKEKTKK